jgi:hypothetical protein
MGVGKHEKSVLKRKLKKNYFVALLNQTVKISFVVQIFS